MCHGKRARGRQRFTICSGLPLAAVAARIIQPIRQRETICLATHTRPASRCKETCCIEGVNALEHIVTVIHSQQKTFVVRLVIITRDITPEDAKSVTSSLQKQRLRSLQKQNLRSRQKQRLRSRSRQKQRLQSRSRSRQKQRLRSRQKQRLRPLSTSTRFHQRPHASITIHLFVFRFSFTRIAICPFFHPWANFSSSVHGPSFRPCMWGLGGSGE